MRCVIMQVFELIYIGGGDVVGMKNKELVPYEHDYYKNICVWGDGQDFKVMYYGVINHVIV